MVDKRIGKTNRVMAQGTVGRGCRVRRSGRFGPGSNGSNCREVSIVTGDTIAGDALVSQHRCRREAVDIVTNIAILCRRHVVCILDQVSAGIARQRQELADMAAFTTVGKTGVNVGEKLC